MRSWEQFWERGDEAGSEAFVDFGVGEAELLLRDHGLNPVIEPVSVGSAENRIFRVALAEGEAVLKVFRFGVAPIEARREQLEFVDRLARQGLRVAGPRPLSDGGLVGEWCNQIFAIFDWCEGDEPPEGGWADDAYRSLGMDIARVHSCPPDERLALQFAYTPDTWGRECREFLLRSGRVYPALQSSFALKSEEVLRRANAEWPDDAWVPIHSDLGHHNVLWPGGKPAIIDFDDMGVGSGLQDLYLLPRAMVRSGRCDESDARRIASAMQDGYRSVRPLPEGGASLVPFIHAMRSMYLDAWAWARRHDRYFRFQRLSGHTRAHWTARVELLERCLASR